ncbi:hypothetical protein PACTADRAFT_4777 [Pachysolen tannophilus NRRL Y-2460]|uniref:Uncharacterized protein n=1 Tax=Pachysolen tannophilus NRRL Y-2460 TaxID=669874 RepID=A0A1E4TQ50_PACTA|nr:hypothetical protein PACTADRAFT_4777 [Pachysolen tannophilus NRRL Y-2460]
MDFTSGVSTFQRPLPQLRHKRSMNMNNNGQFYNQSSSNSNSNSNSHNHNNGGPINVKKTFHNNIKHNKYNKKTDQSDKTIDTKKEKHSIITLEKLAALKKYEPRLYCSKSELDYVIAVISPNHLSTQDENVTNFPKLPIFENSQPFRSIQPLLSTYTDTSKALEDDMLINEVKKDFNSDFQDPCYAFISRNIEKSLNGNEDFHLALDNDGTPILSPEEFKTAIFENMNRPIPSSVPETSSLKNLNKKRSIVQLKADDETEAQSSHQHKRHKYEIPLENSRTISAKEVLRMVDSSLISSDMDFSGTSNTTTENTTSDTPAKKLSALSSSNDGNRSFLSNLTDTPIKSMSMTDLLVSTPANLNYSDIPQSKVSDANEFWKNRASTPESDKFISRRDSLGLMNLVLNNNYKINLNKK